MHPQASMDKGRIPATVAAVATAMLVMTFACAPAGPQDAPPAPTPPSPESRDYGSSDGRLIEIEARLAEISSRLDAQSAAVERVFDALEKLSASLQRERGAHPGVDRDARAGKLLPEKNPHAMLPRKNPPQGPRAGTKTTGSQVGGAVESVPCRTTSSLEQDLEFSFVSFGSGLDRQTVGNQRH